MGEYERLQKKLIPVNIVVMVLCLVAALSIFFAPLLTIDLGKVTTEITSAVQTGSNEEQSGDGETFDMEQIIGMIAKGTEGVKLNISAAGMLEFASSENPAGRVTKYIGDIMSRIEDDLFSMVAVTFLPNLIENYDPGLEIDTGRVDVNSLTGKFNEVFAAGSEEQTDAAIAAFVDELQRQAVAADGTQVIADDVKAPLADTIKEFYSEADEIVDGDVTLENFICVTVSQLINGTDENQEGEDKVYITYEELLGGITGGNSESSTEDVTQTIKEFLPYLKYASYAMFGFGGLWLVLFVFALFRLFTKNKRFMMWYVKLTGFYPCFIFGILPLAYKGIFAAMVPAETGINIAALIGAFSTMTWISGACYLLLWIVSVFWAFPIKHKIRYLKKHGDY